MTTDDALEEMVQNRIDELVQKNIDRVDETIKNRLSINSYCPELTRALHDKVESIVRTFVDNYLRLNAAEIQAAAYRAVDAKLEATISGVVKARLKHVAEKLSKILEAEAPK